MKLLVAIHDVTPAHDHAVRRLFAQCAARHVTPALFVVPNWHGQWPLERDASFVDWLKQCAGDGCELFLHGHRHDEVGSPRDWLDELRAIGRTDGEGEFLTLRADAARHRIAEGLERLEALGLSPVGFVAPAWLSRPECNRVVAEAGFAVSEDSHAVYLHRRGVRLESPVMRWSARSAWRAHMSAAVAAATSWYHRDHWLVRLAFHPQDLAHRATAASIDATLDHWVERRVPWSYTGL